MTGRGGVRISFQAKGQREGSPSLSRQHTSMWAIGFFTPTEGQARGPETAWETGEDPWREAGDGGEAVGAEPQRRRAPIVPLRPPPPRYGHSSSLLLKLSYWPCVHPTSMQIVATPGPGPSSGMAAFLDLSVQRSEFTGGHKLPWPSRVTLPLPKVSKARCSLFCLLWTPHFSCLGPETPNV